jgi:hypothetical protein
MRTLFDLLSDRNTRRFCWRFAAGKEKSDCESGNPQDESHSGIFRTTSTKFTKNISSSVYEIDGMQADWASSPWNSAKADLFARHQQNSLAREYEFEETAGRRRRITLQVWQMV